MATEANSGAVSATDNPAKEQPKAAKPKADTPTREQQRDPVSRPVFKQTVSLRSVQAQRVMDRSFARTTQAFFSTEVILRILDRGDFVDEVNDMINVQLQQFRAAIADALSVNKAKVKEAGITQQPVYTHAREFNVELSTPQSALFLGLVMQLDELVSYFDSLWWATVIKGMERSNETYKWQQMMFKLAGRIQGIEQRARRSASKQGKDALVDAEAPPSTSQDESQHANDDVALAMAEGQAETSSEAVAA
ncbi:hypothetical protein [Comamonas sp. C11]|uniref:hypothetical protein n=1 Tax=Comamonas sp. C11 TaxID=2966554 RepID=UPI0021110D47|nr:hypothetical protein [Comamonas sp. C11]UUC96393.1 hypothetical protein NOX35_27370 [Comamonas sp. C11]